MKSHRQDAIYDMSSLKEVIKTQEERGMTQENKINFTCKKCEMTFESRVELRTHIRSKHPTFKPCKNFPGCSYGENCDFNHITLKENTEICWECGQTFTEKLNLMNHRKTAHKTNQHCKKLKEIGGCPRSAETCWYSHDENNSTSSGLNMNTLQDFPQAPQNKRRPLYSEMVTGQPNQAVMAITEMMTDIKEQSTLMMGHMKKIPHSQ